MFCHRRYPPTATSFSAVPDFLFLFACTQEIPFLRSLLEGLGGAQDPGQSRGSNGAVKTTPSSASSTFLCLQLVGDDKSPLFEVSCRALFRLLPLELPRFIERLARFRAYADEIKKRGAGATEASLQDESSDDEGEGKEGDRQPPLLRRGRQRTSWSSGDARSEATLRGDAGGGVEHGDSSTVSGSDEHHQHRPTSPMSRTGTASRRQSEDNASDSGGRVGHPPTRASSGAGTSRERSPEQATPVPASPNPSFLGAPDDSTHPVTALADAAVSHHQPSGEERSHGTPPVATAYFSRALACLPPAVEDDRGDSAGSQRRRARLSLLLGARKFTEACRLLRHRAWGCLGGAGGTGAVAGSSGKRGSWRVDRGAAEAWSANMRLLNELNRAAAASATTDKAEDAAAAAVVAAGERVGDMTASLSPAAAAETAGNGSVALQFRLAFEDTLAETILEDSPERMKEVMLCRPSGLTPVKVVRMVRRAAEAGVALPTTVVADGGVGGSDDAEETQPPRCGSTQTLKMCLLLLLEDGTREGVGAV